MDTKNETEINYYSPREDKIRYMIKVMQADLDGKEIESYSIFEEKWLGIDDLVIAPRPWEFSDWRPDKPSFPQYRIKPGEPKKKKAVWEVMHRYGPMAGGFISLEAASWFLKLCGNHKTVECISRVEWDGVPVLDGGGRIIENPYDLLEDF